MPLFWLKPASRRQRSATDDFSPSKLTYLRDLNYGVLGSSCGHSSPAHELIKPLIVRRTQERRCSRPKVHRMLRAHVVVECLQVFEGLDELKVVRGRRLAEQGERLDAGIVQT